MIYYILEEPRSGTRIIGMVPRCTISIRVGAFMFSPMQAVDVGEPQSGQLAVGKSAEKVPYSLSPARRARDQKLRSNYSRRRPFPSIKQSDSDPIHQKRTHTRIIKKNLFFSKHPYLFYALILISPPSLPFSLQRPARPPPSSIVIEAFNCSDPSVSSLSPLLFDRSDLSAIFSIFLQ